MINTRHEEVFTRPDGSKVLIRVWMTTKGYGFRVETKEKRKRTWCTPVLLGQSRMTRDERDQKFREKYMSLIKEAELLQAVNALYSQIRPSLSNIYAESPLC